MAAPGMGYFGMTGDALVDSMTHGYYWRLQPDRTVDWALSMAPSGFTWAAGSDQTVAMALSTFAYYANIRFNYVGYYNAMTAAAAAGSEISIAWAGSEIFSSPAHAGQGFFPRSTGWGLYSGDSGDVFFNAYSGIGYGQYVGPGSQMFFLMLHELGHVLGLKHPHDDGGTGRPTFGQIGTLSLDEDWASIMSYNDTYNWNSVGWDPATPMILDVLALQYLYGKNMESEAGNSLHELAEIGAYVTLWDASGSDTLSAHGNGSGWLIVLPDEALSSLVDTKVGLSAPLYDFNLPAPTTLYWLAGDYENVVGSSYADAINGNAFSNIINAGYGDDLVDGGGGVDIAIFSGSVGQYGIRRDGTDVIVWGPDGTDTLMNVERLIIGGTKIAVDVDGHGGQAYRLYQAAFNRAPDAGGLGYQMNALDQGLALTDVAANFIASPEFQRTYGSLSNTQFVTQLYANVLHREPDAAGLQFHVNHLNNGMPRAVVLVGFSESPENQSALDGIVSQGMHYL
jgi:hypothetical protein